MRKQREKAGDVARSRAQDRNRDRLTDRLLLNYLRPKIRSVHCTRASIALHSVTYISAIHCQTFPSPPSSSSLVYNKKKTIWGRLRGRENSYNRIYIGIQYRWAREDFQKLLKQ